MVPVLAVSKCVVCVVERLEDVSLRREEQSWDRKKIYLKTGRKKLWKQFPLIAFLYIVMKIFKGVGEKKRGAFRICESVILLPSEGVEGGVINLGE